MDLVDQVRRNIRRCGFLSCGDTLIVGVSGGPDSVALLHALVGLQHELGLKLCVAHFNHCLRKTALRDQKFVQQLAENLSLPCRVEVWKRRNERGSLEELARLERIEFFRSLAAETKAAAIILGHTRDDLAETVLMRILRGTGLQGMRGILLERHVQGVCLFRPLLDVSKKEILVHLKKRRIPFCLDETNRQKKFLRNKIRMELLPLIERQYNKNIKELLCHLADNAAVDYAYLEGQARLSFRRIAKCSKDGRNVRFGLQVLARRPLALRRMLIRIAVECLKGDTNRLTLKHSREIEDLIDQRPEGSIVHLPDMLCAQKTGGFLRLFVDDSG